MAYVVAIDPYELLTGQQADFDARDRDRLNRLRSALLPILPQFAENLHLGSTDANHLLSHLLLQLALGL